MDVKEKVKTASSEIFSGGFTASFFNFFQGRATTFAIVFTICGLILAFKGKLDGNYALFVTAVQSLVFAHSCKEDWNAYKHRQLDIQCRQNDANTTK